MTKTKIEIKSRFIGNILFEYEKEENTIKDTVEEAVNKGANLKGANLEGAYLEGANLYGAYLEGAYLYGANLEGAYLYGANLEGANLKGANLEGAYLEGANLYGAYLYGAYLEGAYLYGANLKGAYLYGANLKGAYLKGAYLYGAYLEGANLEGAYLEGAYLKGAKEIPYVPLACPSDGPFIGWKKVYGNLVKLEIPEDAKRSSATGLKCRCDKAMVLAITDLEGNNPMDEILNMTYEHHVLYKVGEMVYPDSFDENRFNECSHGIHFFINKQDAIDY